ncbi:MAG TPA: hypothetical protein VKB35_14260 [Ktedonobacteraceae bacterium]|nr:hypothetical protein [Ktedonobacteraceae bacterium]
MPSVDESGDLEQPFTAWRERRLPEHWRIVYAGRECISLFVMETRPMPPSF